MRPFFIVLQFVSVLLTSVLHFLDRCLAALFLGDLGEFDALFLRELAHQREITALQLTRCELLGRNGGALTATLLGSGSSGCCCLLTTL